MRLPRLVPVVLAVVGLCGCGQLGSISLPPVQVTVPAGAVLFDPPRLAVGVGRTEPLALRLTYDGFERLTLVWGDGSGEVAIADLSCIPADSCTIEQQGTGTAGRTVLRLHRVRSIAMRVSGVAAGQERLEVSLFAAGGCEPGVVDVCYAGTTVSQSATVEVRP